VTEHLAREDLVPWWAWRPTNCYEVTPNLQSVIEIRVGATPTAAMDPDRKAFGHVIVEVIDPAVETLEHHRPLPTYVPDGGIGRRVDQIESHPEDQLLDQAVWTSGILAVNPDGSGGLHNFIRNDAGTRSTDAGR